MQKVSITGAEPPDEFPVQEGSDEEPETGPVPWLVFVWFGGSLMLIILIQMMCATP